jgi:ATP-binding cassette subfamily B protein
MTLYVIAFRQGQQSFQSVLGSIGSIYEHNLYMSNLFDFLSLEPTKPLADARGTESPQVSSGNGRAADATGQTPDANGLVAGEFQYRARERADRSGIVFEDVGFKYPDKENWALRHISLDIPAGQSVALVGENGAGKTTLVKLVTRLYEPTKGRILLDGKDLREWDEADLRGRFGVVFQDFNRYQLLARENVGVGSLDHIEDQERVERAVTRGGAEPVVSGLPEKMDTMLGKWFLDGQELSGGQWQKIALSRGFMREQADILVLDEPTAALDAEAEHAVFERFKELSQGKTTIIISHRFPTVRMADRILVLENGKIIEDGTHAALVAANKTYARLYEMQARGYL